jgi:hypothetical protein
MFVPYKKFIVPKHFRTMVLKIGEIGSFRFFSVNSRNNAPKKWKNCQRFQIYKIEKKRKKDHCS